MGALYSLALLRPAGCQTYGPGIVAKANASTASTVQVGVRNASANSIPTHAAVMHRVVTTREAFRKSRAQVEHFKIRRAKAYARPATSPLQILCMSSLLEELRTGRIVGMPSVATCATTKITSAMRHASNRSV